MRTKSEDGKLRENIVSVDVFTIGHSISSPCYACSAAETWPKHSTVIHKPGVKKSFPLGDTAKTQTINGKNSTGGARFGIISLLDGIFPHTR